ncbi:YegJ family protein [Hymenobacter rigui]|nr:DUF2314 domain-containing protein [Hymenobacter rigui]
MAAFLLGSCQHAGKETGWDAKKQMYFAKTDDPEMAEAIRQSRETVNQFLTALASGDTTAYNFGVKAAFPIPDGTNEHIWLTDIRANGDSIIGVIDNQPDVITAVKFGQQVAIHKDSITDWNYTKNGKLIGGYSIRLMRRRMSKEEQAEFDKQMSFTIE